MRRATVVAGTLFVLGAGTVGYSVFMERRDAELRILLESIGRAEKETRYAGTRSVSVHENGGVRKRILRISSDGSRPRVESVSSEPRERKESRGFPSLLRPGHGMRGRIHDVDLAVKNYEIRIVGRQFVAGREGDIVEIRPRHPGRPSYRIVADRTNRFPLSFEVLSDSGAPVLDTRFDSIDFAPEFSEGTFGERKRHGFPSWIRVTNEPIADERLAERAGFSIWTPRILPAGFELSRTELKRVSTSPPPGFPMLPMDCRVLHRTYTDGMAILSIVQFASANPAWRIIQTWLPPVKDSGGIVARKFSHAMGCALLMDLGETVVLLAGNVSGTDVEAGARSLVKNEGRRTR